MLKLLSLFIVIPFIELIIIVKIGNRIGFWPALALIAVPGLLGAAMARSQGTAVFARIKSDIARGRLPGSEIIDGILIFAGGLLLITPGFITDIAGLTVLFPQARKYYRAFILRWLWHMAAARRLGLYIKRPM